MRPAQRKASRLKSCIVRVLLRGTLRLPPGRSADVGVGAVVPVASSEMGNSIMGMRPQKADNDE